VFSFGVELVHAAEIIPAMLSEDLYVEKMHRGSVRSSAGEEASI
jgi:hypothetical protein